MTSTPKSTKLEPAMNVKANKSDATLFQLWPCHNQNNDEKFNSSSGKRKRDGINARLGETIEERSLWENKSLLNGPMLLLRSVMGGMKGSERKSTRDALASLPDWNENVTFTIFGKPCRMRRRICQYSTGGKISYSYSGLKNIVSPEFPKVIQELKCQVEDLIVNFVLKTLSNNHGANLFGKNLLISQEFIELVKTIEEQKNLGKTMEIFNYCLLNHYRNGEEYMGYHADDESSLDPNCPIASVSFGVTRKFDIRKRKKVAGNERRSRLERISLGDGDVLFMFPPMQDHYEHSVPVEKRIMGDRINLTFRRIVT